MIKLSFDRERETKNTVRFQEREGDEPALVGALYLQKAAFARLGDPKTLSVKIEPGPGSQG